MFEILPHFLFDEFPGRRYYKLWTNVVDNSEKTLHRLYLKFQKSITKYKNPVFIML
jgi:hypothetical protein